MTVEPRPAPGLGRIAAVLVGGYLLVAIMSALAVRLAYADVPAREISHGMAAFGMMLMYVALFGVAMAGYSAALAWWLWRRVRIWLVALAAVPVVMLCFVAGFFLMAG